MKQSKRHDQHMQNGYDYFQRAKQEGFGPDDVPWLIEVVDTLFLYLTTLGLINGSQPDDVVN